MRGNLSRTERCCPMSLTNVACKNAKPRPKPYKLTDERGLYLEVATSRSKWWRFKFSFADKREPNLAGRGPREARRRAQAAGDWHQPLPASQARKGSQHRCRSQHVRGRCARVVFRKRRPPGVRSKFCKPRCPNAPSSFATIQAARGLNREIGALSMTVSHTVFRWRTANGPH